MCSQYLRPDGKKWIGVPLGCAGNALVYRTSQLKAAGFDSVPKDMDGFLRMMKALKDKGTPGGFALGNATGDGNTWTHWLVWAHGGKLVNEKNEVVINSPETIRALEYVEGALRHVRARARCRGSTRTTTRRSSTARSRITEQRHLGLLRGEERDRPEDEGAAKPTSTTRTSRSGPVGTADASSTCSSTR